MATPYRYECTVHGSFLEHFPMGEALRHTMCPECGLQSPRDYSAAIQFTYGKDEFHGPTLGERIEQQQKDCAADGVRMEPVGNRWV